MHMAPHRGINFARAQLEKYGWTEGKGLGVNESGITEALKPKLKFDTSGIGHDAAEQFTYHWWENAYNQAAENLEVCRNEDGVAVKVHDDSFDISTKKYLAKSSRTGSNLLYGNFLKTSTLTGDGHIVQECEELSQPIKSISAVTLTDEELLKACGGLTAHKGARHGLTLSGKLSRIQEQEQKLLGSMKDKENAVEFFTGDDHCNGKDKKKKKKRANEESAGIEDLATVGSIEPQRKKKKNKEVDDLSASNIASCENNDVSNVDESIGFEDLATDGSIEPQRKKKKKNKRVNDLSESNLASHENNEDVSNVDESAGFEDLATDGSIEPQRKKKKKNKGVSDLSESNITSCENNEDVPNVDDSAGLEDLATVESIEPQRKKKKKKKVVCELSESNIASRDNNETVTNVDENAKIEDLATVGSSEHKKKRKKSKEAGISDENMEASYVEEHRRKKYEEPNESADRSLSMDWKNEGQCTEMENETRASDDVSNNIDYPSHVTKKRPPLTWRETPEGWICCRCAAVEDNNLNNNFSNGDGHAPHKKKKKENKDNNVNATVERNTVDQPDSIFDGLSTFDEHNSQKRKHKFRKCHSEELPHSQEGVDQISKEEEKQQKRKKYKLEVGDCEQTYGECHMDTTLEHSTEDSVLLGNTSEVIDNSSKKMKQKEKHLENGDEANVLENISGMLSKKEKKKKKLELENAVQDSTVPQKKVIVS